MASKPTALLCTSNGVGLGHLSRVMAVGRHMEPEFDVVIFTLSAAVSIPVSQGFHTEYLRSHEYSEFDGRAWNSLFEQRLEHLHDLYQPEIVLFDGTHPYAGLCRFLDRHPEAVRVWERRGMWRSGFGEAALLRARHFDAVIEPGDYARAYDRGATSHLVDGVRRCAPIRYGAAPMDRVAARRALGLEPERVVALVQLGAGQINDVHSLMRRIVDLLVAADVEVVVAASVLAQPPRIEIEGVSVVQHYPISDYFGAFDMAFLAGGYNSFHEALSLALPSVFAPNLSTKLDDQAARTRFAHDHGYGLDWSDGERGTLERLVDRILDASERDRMRSAMATLPPADGGAEVAAHLHDLVSVR
jgi:UDP:flavonoid glycosyltransferase YjiC (YdhE family)